MENFNLGLKKITLGQENANQPVANQPVANQPVANQPVANQPVANQPVANQPVANQPVANQPVDYAQYADIASQYQDSVVKKLPVLKINYSLLTKTVKAGDWVLGQKKRFVNGVEEIENEGVKVTDIIILSAMNMYNYYHPDEKQRCHSTVFADFSKEVIRGNNFKNDCRHCPYRKSELKNRCKAQKVVYALALLEGGAYEPCAIFIKGVDYWSFNQDFLPSLKFIENNQGKKIPTPIFSWVISLSSNMSQKGATVFYQAVFTKKNLLPIETVKELTVFVDKIKEFINQINSKNANSNDNSKNEEYLDNNDSGEFYDSETFERLNDDELDEILEKEL